jgi:ArsR family transcriptional regulator
MVAILDHMSALSDPTRCRMLLLLEKHELTVSELCAVLQMPQSSVSRHLKTLSDDDWVMSRRDGTSRFYSMPVDELDSGAKRLWPLIREQVAATSAAGQDDRRLKGVLTRRRAKSQEFFASAAAGWDRLRSDLFGDTFFLWAVLGLIDQSLVVGDLGCGTGQLTEIVAPYVKRVIAVDGSPDMLDAAVLSLVLHYSPSPGRALTEVARGLRKGGRALVVDMLPHDRQEYQQQMGHVWLGFSEKQIARYLAGAGFGDVRVRMLPADPEAKGPALFAAAAVKQ